MTNYIPHTSKYKKYHKGKKLFKLKNTFNILNFKTSLALKALEPGRLNSKQLIALRQTLNKLIKKRGKNYIKIFPTIGVSKKPKEIRMGKGKGALDHWIFKVKAGVILCEMFTTSLPLGIKALKIVKKKIPLKTQIIQSL
jgi:large subunit ribosomal protein L16